MSFKTTDLCDVQSDEIQIAEPVFGDFGGNITFHGEISTVKCFEDNSMIRAALETPGTGRVLVVDGGGSLRCTLIGDKMAALAKKNGWPGAIVNGCIRDCADVATIGFGLKALAPHPRRSAKKGIGDRDIAVQT